MTVMVELLTTNWYTLWYFDAITVLQRWNVLECDDMSRFGFDATCRVLRKAASCRRTP